MQQFEWYTQAEVDAENYWLKKREQEKADYEFALKLQALEQEEGSAAVETTEKVPKRGDEVIIYLQCIGCGQRRRGSSCRSFTRVAQVCAHLHLCIKYYKGLLMRIKMPS